MTPRGAGTTASAAPLDDRIRTRAARDQGSARLGAAQVREDLPDDGGVVQRGDQPQPASAVRARQHVNGKCPVHQRPWIQAGAKDLMDRAAAGTRG